MTTKYTWDAWLAHVSKNPTVSERNRRSEDRDRDGQRQTATYADALDLARKGWPEGLKEIRAQFTAIKAALNTGDEMTSRLADSGDDVDTGLFLEGDPEHWIEYPLMPKANPVVKLVVSISASYGVNAETIFRKGAAIVAVVDGLEASGEETESVDARGKLPCAASSARPRPATSSPSSSTASVGSNTAATTRPASR